MPRCRKPARRKIAGKRNKPRRSLLDPSDPFNILSTKEFIQMFRLSKDTVGIVLYYLQFTNLKDDEFPLHVQLLSTLAYYGTGQCASAEAMLGVSGNAVKLIISDVSRGICDFMRERYLSFPDNQELATFQEDFLAIAHIHRVIGTVESISIPIQPKSCSETGMNHISYRKQSMKVLIVCGPHGQITHVIVQINDACHDWEVLCKSNLYARLTMGQYGDVVLLTDETYSVHPYLLRPIDSPATVSEDLFNISHFITRLLVRQTFQEMTTRFPCLTNGMDPIYPTNLDIVLACAILHNVCLRRKVPLPDTEKRIIY